MHILLLLHPLPFVLLWGCSHCQDRGEGLGGGDNSDWICRIKPNNLAANLGALRIAEDGVKWIYEELLRLQEMVVMQMPRLQTVGITMQDGPLALDNLLEALDDETWNVFQNEFLKGSADKLEEK